MSKSSLWQRAKNRVKAFRRGPAWYVFLGVFWALVAYRLLEIFSPL